MNVVDENVAKAGIMYLLMVSIIAFSASACLFVV
jgi:hypothetical protein